MAMDFRSSPFDSLMYEGDSILNWQTKLKFSKKSILPMIMQDEIADCGHACIAMIIHFWRCKLNLSSLRRRFPSSVRGMNLLQMNQIFNQLGFKTRVLRINWQVLSKVKLPAILHWDNNHFVVLKKINRQTWTIHDPALGVRVLPNKMAQTFFSGIVLEIEQANPIVIGKESSHLTLGKLLRTILGMPKVFILLLVLTVMIELLQIINPMLTQYMTDHVIGSQIMSQLYSIGLGCLIFALLHGLIDFLRSHLVLYTSMQITESFATEVFQHVIKLPLQFFVHRHYSDIHAKFQVIDHLKTQLNTDFWTTFLDVFMIAITLCIMMFYSPTLVGIMVCVLLVHSIALSLNFRTYQQQLSQAFTLHAKTAITFYEALRGIVTIKSFLKESLWLQLWRNNYIEALNHDIQISKLQIYFRVFNQILFHVDYILLICVGAGLVIKQRLSIGMLLAFLAYRMILVNKTTSFIQYLFTYQGVSLQLQRLQDLIEHEPEVQDTRLYTSLVSGTIKVHNISFSYPGNSSMLLKDLSFHIQPGEKIAIIGPSGCGKTTLLKILMGLERPTAGNVLIDDIPLPLFGLQNFRQLLAAVMQDDELFSGSILDNISFFSDEIDMNWLYDVAKLACVHDTIMSFPMGYETLIGQSQMAISGGQKQRILLARALYKKPKFLFLDEATSHLDLKLEASINQSLQNCHITQIIVAHRPETIAKVDRVIRL